MLMFGLRLGDDPRVVVTTTPRPTKLIRTLVGDPKVRLTRGTTADNRGNLAPAFLHQIVRRAAGTRLGRQALDAELLEDVPGALWSRAVVEAARTTELPELQRIVVAIDPAATSGGDADETGIVVVGKAAGANGIAHGYVLADLSGRYTPPEWAKVALTAWRVRGADRIVAEVNNGGEMVEATLRAVDPDIPFSAVRAARGKVARAEPVAALYEQGRVHHLGAFPLLEDQMCAFTSDFDRAKAGYSPDRVDALVWALNELLVTTMAGEGMFELYRRNAATGGDPQCRCLSKTPIRRCSRYRPRPMATATSCRCTRPLPTNTQGVSTPVGPGNPLPVINAAASVASDGSGTLASGGSAQSLFGGSVPVNGFLVQNNSSAALYGVAMPALPRTAERASSSPRVAGSSRRRAATSRRARSAFTAPRPARPSPRRLVTR